MKIFFISLFLPLVVFANGEKLTSSQHSSIHGYNHRPSVQMQYKRNMHRLHNIDEEEAARLTKDATGENIETLKLKDKNPYLVYDVSTKNYHLTINALDGSIMEKEKK